MVPTMRRGMIMGGLISSEVIGRKQSLSYTIISFAHLGRVS